MSWEELARALGPSARDDTVFGTLGTPAKLARQVGRKHAVRSTHTPEGNEYWLDPTVKDLFTRVSGTVVEGDEEPSLGVSSVAAMPALSEPTSEEIRELTTREAFRWALAHESIVITSRSGNIFHQNPWSCGHVTEENFELKVLMNHGRNGRYYAVGNFRDAEDRWSGVTRWMDSSCGPSTDRIP